MSIREIGALLYANQTNSFLAELRYEHFWLGLGGLFAITILYLSLIDLPLSDNYIPHQDKVLHLIAFFGMTLWFSQLVRGLTALLMIMVVMLCFGGLIEMLQMLTPYREASKWDLVADALGIGFAGTLALTPLRDTLKAIEHFLP